MSPPPTLGEWGHIAFGADPVGVYIASSLHSTDPMGGFWPNWHRHMIGIGEKSDYILVTLTSFSRSHQHFECQILTKNSLSANYLLNQMMDSCQILCIVYLSMLDVQRDLTSSVHTVNNFHCLVIIKRMYVFVFEDHILDWHSCQICYPLDIKLVFIIIVIIKDLILMTT